MQYTYRDIALLIDHSLLGPVLTDAELDAGCTLADRYGVASVCIKPYYVRRAADLLADSAVKVGTVIGFPHGGHTTAIKLAEARAAMDDGALELDMVVNVGKVLSGDWRFVRADIAAVTDAAHARGAIVKVIFENCFLKDEHKVRLCEVCGELGVDFVKTSTGCGPGGATIEDLKLMRAHSPAHVQVKAAGGIRTLDALLEAHAAGAARVGATRTAEMLDECRRRVEDACGTA